MSLTIEPIANSFARRVTGANLWNGLSETQLPQVRQAWSEAGVLVFARQALSEDELTAFSAQLGVPEPVVRTDWASERCPEVVLLSNLRDDAGRPIGMPGTGEVGWHSDQSYVITPATGAALYAVELPADGGGCTYWANTMLAYDALPASLARTIEDCRVIYSYAQRLAGYDDKAKTDSEEVRRKTPEVSHALVNRHPVTGRPSLFLDLSTAIGVEGMSESEGKALLNELREQTTRPEFVYRHQWQPGDLVLWDNSFMMHRRDQYDSAHRRFHKKTTIRLPAEHHITLVGRLMQPA